MDKKFARKYFYEKRMYKILRYVSYALLGVGVFSFIFLWSGVEIGTPFLIVGVIILWFVSSMTVSGKDFLLQAESILNNEIINLQNELSSKEGSNGSIILSKQFIFDSSSNVKKATKNELVSPSAQVVAMYCNDKANRFHVLATTIDFVGGSKEEIDIDGCLSNIQFTKHEVNFTKFGCMKKQLKTSLILPNKTFEFFLDDDYITHKFVDDYFVNLKW